MLLEKKKFPAEVGPAFAQIEEKEKKKKGGEADQRVFFRVAVLEARENGEYATALRRGASRWDV